MSKETDHRLPNTVRPEKYTIELRPDLTRFTFQGEESVAIRVLRPVKTIELNASQFEVTDARRACPCWDEPAAKATFQVSLVAPEGMAAVSNTPIVGEKDLGDGTRLVQFEETPRMATYLLAFVIGPLETLDGKTRTGTKVGVPALPDRIAHARLGLEESIRVLDYLNEYYGVPYP